MKKILYKYLRTGLKSDNGEDRAWKLGTWRIEKGDLDICRNGFHASKTPRQALSYVNGEILAKVEVRGKSIKKDDKECWSEMRIVEAYYWTKEDSVALAAAYAAAKIKLTKEVDAWFIKYIKKLKPWKQ